MNYEETKNSELKELLRLIKYEIQQAKRPPNEVILDDDDVMRHLKISKRTLQYMKSNRVITYRRFDPSSPRTYYLLSDILEKLEENCVEAISSQIRIK
jgi:hypothetical protein